MESGDAPGREEPAFGGIGDAPVIADHPLEQLAPAARSMVEAATRVLMRDGADGVTLRAVAEEAGVYADSIRYYFGGKQGLLKAVSLNISHDLTLALMSSLNAAEDESQRLSALSGVIRSLAEDSDSYRVWWALVPQILADEQWTRREADDYEWCRRLYAHFIPLRPAELGTPSDPQRARNLTALIVAVVDGLAFQKAIDPTNVDLDGIVSLWCELLTPALREALEPGAGT
jgi:AcrR family transcriptional regulator